MLGGDKQLAVVKSGHIQSFVNPATKSRYDYWEGPPAGDDPDRWLAGAAEHHGSWWPQWIEWLIAHPGPERIGSLNIDCCCQMGLSKISTLSLMRSGTKLDSWNSMGR